MIYVISNQKFYDISVHSYTKDEYTGTIYILMSFRFHSNEPKQALNITLQPNGNCYATDFYQDAGVETERLRNVTKRVSSSAMLHALDKLVQSEAFKKTFLSQIEGSINLKKLYVERSELFETELGETITGIHFYAYRFYFDLYKKYASEKNWWLFGSFYWSKTGCIYELELELDTDFQLTGYHVIHVDKPYKQHLLNERKEINEIVEHYKPEIQEFLSKSKPEWMIKYR